LVGATSSEGFLVHSCSVLILTYRCIYNLHIVLHHAYCRATIERHRVYQLTSNGVDGSRTCNPETAFVTVASSTSDVEQRVFSERKLSVHSLWSYKKNSPSGAAVNPRGTVRRHSQPCPLPTKLESYAVPYQSPRSDETPAEQPSSEGLSSADRPRSSPSDAVVETDGASTSNAKATVVGAATTSVDGKKASESDDGRPRSLAESDTMLRRSASLRQSSDGDRKRRAHPTADVGRVVVRRRAASFGAGGTSTNDVGPSRCHRRRMSSFSQRHPPDDLLARTADVPRTGGRLEDAPGLPPIHRPASGESGGRGWRPPRADEAAVRATAATTTAGSSDRPTTKDASTQRRRSHELVSGGDKRTAAEKNSGPHRHDGRYRQRHRRCHGNDDQTQEQGGDEGHRSHRHRHLRHRSSSEHRRTSADGAHRAASTMDSALDDDSHHHRNHHHRRHRHRSASLDRDYHSTPSID